MQSWGILLPLSEPGRDTSRNEAQPLLQKGDAFCGPMDELAAVPAEDREGVV